METISNLYEESKYYRRKDDNILKMSQTMYIQHLKQKHVMTYMLVIHISQVFMLLFFVFIIL